MKKTICFPFVGDSLGGSHYSSLELINNLDKKEFKIIIILHTKGRFYRYLKEKKYNFFYLPIKNFVGNKKGFFINIFCILRLILPIRRFINKNKYIIIKN